MHAALLCKELNPRIGWCFSSESFMGVCRKLILHSNQGYKGKCGIDTCNLALRKYAHGIHYAMEDMEFFFWGV